MSNFTVDDLAIEIVNAQGKIQKRMSGSLSVHGISLSDYMVLKKLYGASSQKMRRSDLAEQVALTPSGITRLLNPLEKIGLVKKETNPRDARVSLVALTAAGSARFEEAQVAFSSAASDLFKSLDNNAQNSLSKLLHQIT